MVMTIEVKVGKDAWLQGYAESSQWVYDTGLELFLRFMNETEQGEWDDKRLLKEREEDLKSRAYAFEQKLVEFYDWLKTYKPTHDIKKLSDNTRKSYLRAVRSFFAYHRLDVKFTRQQRAKISKKARPKRAYYDFTLDDIKKMAGVSKPKERYILLVGKELGLRASDFITLKQGTFLAHLNEDAPVALGEVYTQKEGVNALPFLGHDGKQAVKQWLTVLKSKDRYDPDKPMLKIREQELSEILTRLAERANINTGGQRVRFHQLRVFLITRLSKVLESNRWKQIVGKTVPESAYVKPFELREDYRKVLPLITVNTTASLPQREELQKINARIVEVQSENIMLRRALDAKVKSLEEKIAQLFEYARAFELLREAVKMGLTTEELKAYFDFIERSNNEDREAV